MNYGARVIEVVETTLALRGDGKTTPIRRLTQYWDKDGNLLAEKDPTPDAERTEKFLQARIEELENAVKFALGEVDSFPQKKPGEGAYWWRSELRRRANLAPF